jgi:hypothetical protein
VSESPPRASHLGSRAAEQRHNRHARLEAVDLDGLLVETETGVLVNEEVFDLEALVALELDHLSQALGLGVADDGAIAGELFLDDLENLLAVELGGYTLNGGQGLTSITLLNANMDIFLGLSGLSRVLVGFGEGV